MSREEFERFLRFISRNQQEVWMMLWDRLEELRREVKEVRDQLSDERSE